MLRIPEPPQPGPDCVPTAGRFIDPVVDELLAVVAALRLDNAALGARVDALRAALELTQAENRQLRRQNGAQRRGWLGAITKRSE